MNTALSIAGSDSSGGAGIQADIKTMTMHSVYAMSVITAITAQNTKGVKAVENNSPQIIDEQVEAVLSDIFPDAIKIGMLSTCEIIQVVTNKLKKYQPKNIVLDPVMISTSGHKLISDDAIKQLKEDLMPLCHIVTPNLMEAAVLSGLEVRTAEDMERAAREIAKTYKGYILIKGGHLENKEMSSDLLYIDGKSIWIHEKRIENENTHGTGCTLSSAIAANLAKGFDMYESVRRAKEYLTNAIKAKLDLGEGRGPINHIEGNLERK